MTIPGGRRFVTAWACIGGLLAGLQSSACFFDSQWGAARRAQAAAAQRATPPELRSTPAVASETAIPARKPTRALKVRAYATPRYAAEVVDWPKRLAELLEDADEVLGPTLGIRIEIAGTTTWVPRSGEEDLAALVEELAASDPGQGVDWVVGLIGSVPRVEESFHQLGMGRIPGKHLVMRAMNDAREYEAIEQGFSELDAAERHRLYRARRRHKTATVFLHELGHTLGVPHEIDATTIMHGRYGAKVTGFSEAAAGLMRVTLDHRTDPAAESEPAFAEALVAQVERTAASWVPDEREALLRRLRAISPAPPSRRREQPATEAAAPEPVVAAAPEPLGEDALAALAAGDRSTFNQAVEHQRAGRLSEALTSATPLFAAYPNVIAVQELRCRLAMAASHDWSVIKAQCARLTELTEAPAKKRSR